MTTFVPGKIEREKGFQILFHRDPAGREKNRARKIERDRPLRLEQLGVDAAGPHAEILETAAAEVAHQRSGRDHCDGGGGVEATQQRIGPGFRDRRARGDVFRETRREAGRERQAALAAIGAHGMADRPFRRDVDGVGFGVFDAASDLGAIAQGESQPGIGRHLHRGEAVRRQELNCDAKSARGLCERRQRPHHAIDLRMPGIRRHQYAHHAAPRLPNTAWSGAGN